MRKLVVFLLILVLFLIGLNALGANKAVKQSTNTPISATVIAEKKSDSFSYNGSEGKDALTLLKEKAEVEESQPGFITSINGRKADDTKQEFWAFYVNNEMAQVGAGDYV